VVPVPQQRAEVTAEVAQAFDDRGGRSGVFIPYLIEWFFGVFSGIAGPVITDITVNGGNVEITFKANSSDTTADFVLQESSPSVTGAYGDTASTISSLGGGVFKATKAVPAAQTFYRVRRLP
jgi:hypothetical protein